MTRTFPAAVRLDPSPTEPFADRWRAKRADADELAECSWAILDGTSRRPGRRSFLMSDAVWRNWQVRWAEDLFLGFIPSWDRLPPDRVAASVEDVCASVEAIRYVASSVGAGRAGRFVAYVFPEHVGFPHFPHVGEVRSHHGDFYRRSLDAGLVTRLDYRQFLDRVTFLLNRPTPEDWAWLDRVAYDIDAVPDDDTLGPDERWARRVFPEAVPNLSLRLGIRYDPGVVDPATPFPVLTAAVQNWCVDARAAARQLRSSGGGAATEEQRVAPGAASQPVDPFTELRRFSRAEFKGIGRIVVEALCDAGGELPLADLAVMRGVDWDDPAQGFKDLGRLLRDRLQRQGWRLQRHDNAARLSALPRRGGKRG